MCYKKLHFSLLTRAEFTSKVTSVTTSGSDLLNREKLQFNNSLKGRQALQRDP